MVGPEKAAGRSRHVLLPKYLVSEKRLPQPKIQDPLNHPESLMAWEKRLRRLKGRGRKKKNSIEAANLFQKGACGGREGTMSSQRAKRRAKEKI